jgi:hypothetical protein
VDYNFIVKESYKVNKPMIQIIAFHVESTTLADGTYELLQEPDEGVSEAQVNAIDVTEGSNPTLEEPNFIDPNLTREGKPRCITQYFNYCNYCLYIYCALSSRMCNETLDA